MNRQKKCRKISDGKYLESAKTNDRKKVLNAQRKIQKK